MHNKHNLREKITEAILPAMASSCEDPVELAEACAEAMVALTGAMAKVICVACLPGDMSTRQKLEIDQVVYEKLNQFGLSVADGINKGMDNYHESFRQRN